MGNLKQFQNGDIVLTMEGRIDRLVKKRHLDYTSRNVRYTSHLLEKEGVISSGELANCKVLVNGVSILKRSHRRGFHLCDNGCEVKSTDWAARIGAFVPVIEIGKVYHDIFVGISWNKVRGPGGRSYRVKAHSFIEKNDLLSSEDVHFKMGGVKSHGDSLRDMYKAFIGDIPAGGRVKLIDSKDDKNIYNITLMKTGVVPAFNGWCVNCQEGCFGPYVSREKAERFYDSYCHH